MRLQNEAYRCIWKLSNHIQIYMATLLHILLFFSEGGHSKDHSEATRKFTFIPIPGEVSARPEIGMRATGRVSKKGLVYIIWNTLGPISFTNQA